jgi:cysteinyl-tRNA synthetase
VLQLKNTLTGELEEFKPIDDSEVKMYNCGPTVYHYAHLGNLRAVLLADILKRVLKYNDYDVNQVMNITDVGHLTDGGLDKIEEEAKKEGKTAQEVAEFYTKKFFEDIDKLGVDKSETIYPKASDHINEQIELIKKLESRKFTYTTSDGIYFDSSEYHGYGKLGNINIDELQEGARVEKNDEKKNPTDFALWKFSSSSEGKRQQEWNSPWGIGFPGWHIECSAMSMKYLGESFDIHTGGVDNIFPHHNNEIAQSESATGKTFVNYWLHNAHLQTNGETASKSRGNVFLLDDVIERGLNPLAYRYWLLTSNYDSPINFTWEAVEGSATALDKLYGRFQELPDGGPSKAEAGKVDDNYRALFKGFINDNLNTPRGLALVWELLKDSEISDADKKATLLDFNKVLGLGLDKFESVEVPDEVKKLIEKREEARKEQKWDESDKLRAEITKLGFEVKDTPEGSKVFRK